MRAWSEERKPIARRARINLQELLRALAVGAPSSQSLASLAERSVKNPEIDLYDRDIVLFTMSRARVMTRLTIYDNKCFGD